MCQAVPLPIIRSLPLYIRHWYISCRFDDSFQAWPRWNCSSILFMLEGRHQTCMTYTSAKYTVEVFWWWAEELPETCRVSWHNKFGKLVHLLVLLKERDCIIAPIFLNNVARNTRPQYTPAIHARNTRPPYPVWHTRLPSDVLSDVVGSVWCVYWTK
jgi:hypothetical protein